MPLNSVNVLLVGRALSAVKQSSLRSIVTSGIVDLTDAPTADRAKPLMDSQQKIFTREKNTSAQKIEEDFNTPGIHDHSQDFFIKEQASGGYSAQVKVYNHGKMISDNVVDVQMNRRHKRVFATTI